MLQITITGDISFSKLGQFSMGSSLLSVMQKSDVVIGNLESVLTKAEKPIFWKSYYLKGNPENFQLLESFDAFSMANNHVLDYGKIGLSDTVNLLEQNHKNYFGVGLTKAKAKEPYTYEKNGAKLAIFGATHYFRIGSMRSYGTDDMHSKDLLDRISKYKELGYFVIVMPHWGYEHVAYPSPRERRLARRFLDAGCDAVIGSHPHEMQGIEQINEKVICYSLGNFIFSSSDFKHKTNRRLYESFAVQIDIYESHKYEFRILPYITSDTTVELADNEKSKQILTEIEEISRPLRDRTFGNNDCFYEAMYQRYLTARKPNPNHSPAVRKKDFLDRWKLRLLTLTNVDLQFVKIALYIYSRKVGLKK